MRIEHFTLRVPRPTGPLLPALENFLTLDGALPLRWAVTAADETHLLIEGARLCSPSST